MEDNLKGSVSTSPLQKPSAPSEFPLRLGHQAAMTTDYLGDPPTCIKGGTSRQRAGGVHSTGLPCSGRFAKIRMWPAVPKAHHMVTTKAPSLTWPWLKVKNKEPRDQVKDLYPCI